MAYCQPQTLTSILTLTRVQFSFSFVYTDHPPNNVQNNVYILSKCYMNNSLILFKYRPSTIQKVSMYFVFWEYHPNIIQIFSKTYHLLCLNIIQILPKILIHFPKIVQILSKFSPNIVLLLSKKSPYVVSILIEYCPNIV